MSSSIPTEEAAVTSLSPRPSPPTGTGLFTTKAFSTGELLLRLEGEVLGVLDSPQFGVACEWCYCTIEDEGLGGRGEEVWGGRRLKKCAGCGVVRFCGVKCQNASWKHHHKYECRIFKRLYPKVLPNIARLLMQLLLRHQNNIYPPRDWEAFMKLQHHLEDFKAQKISQNENTWGNMQLIARAVKEYSGSKEDLGQVEAMVGRILINALTLTTPTLTPLGLSLSPTASLLNHSCHPNAAITFSSRTLSVRTLHPISLSSEVLISYIDNSAPPLVRQADLRARYFFACACPACAASPAQTLGRVDPPPALVAALPGPSLAELEDRAMALMGDAQGAEDPTARVEYLRQAFALFAVHPAYPLYRQPFAALRAALVLALLSNHLWIPALLHSLVSYFHIEPFLYPEAIHPVRVVRKWVLLKLVLQVAASGHEGDNGVVEMERRWGVEWGICVWGLLRECEGSVGGSHGEESAFARRVRVEVERFRVDAKEKWVKNGPSGREVERCWATLRRVAGEGLGWWEDREKEGRLLKETEKLE